MCGRYEFNPGTDEWERIEEHVENRGYTFKQNYNTAPTQNMPVLRMDNKTKVLEPMKWGIHRHIGPTIEKDIINTRSDKAFSPFWSKTVRNFRCLIPATGFYEWKLGGKVKTPFFIHPRERHLFMFAGIFSIPEEGLPTYSIMTTEPNVEMREIHNRMPVILEQDLEEAWLYATEDEQIRDFLRPAKDGSLEIYPISTAVNSPRNNYPELSLRNS